MADSSPKKMVAVGIDDGIMVRPAEHEEAASVSEEEKGMAIPKEARKILLKLAAGWSDVADSKAIEVAPLKGAMTNEVYQIKWPSAHGNRPRKVLVRVYGEGVDLLFDRDEEIRAFECVSLHGQGPRLLGRFRNGRVEEFIHARVR